MVWVSKPRCSGVSKGHSNHLQAFKRVKGTFEMVLLAGLEIPILSPETLLMTHCHNLSFSAGKRVDNILLRSVHTQERCCTLWLQHFYN